MLVYDMENSTNEKQGPRPLVRANLQLELTGRADMLKLKLAGEGMLNQAEDKFSET